MRARAHTANDHRCICTHRQNYWIHREHLSVASNRAARRQRASGCQFCPSDWSDQQRWATPTDAQSLYLRPHFQTAFSDFFNDSNSGQRSMQRFQWIWWINAHEIRFFYWFGLVASWTSCEKRAPIFTVCRRVSVWKWQDTIWRNLVAAMFAAVADIHVILPAAWFAQKRLVDAFNERSCGASTECGGHSAFVCHWHSAFWQRPISIDAKLINSFSSKTKTIPISEAANAGRNPHFYFPQRKTVTK